MTLGRYGPSVSEAYGMDRTVTITRDIELEEDHPLVVGATVVTAPMFSIKDDYEERWERLDLWEMSRDAYRFLPEDLDDPEVTVR